MRKLKNGARFPWQRMWRATSFHEPGEELIATFMRNYSIDRAEALARIEAENAEIWTNSIYQVSVHRDEANSSAQLNIRRRDGGPILRDWRHFQAIKNDIIGPECEAVELYPAESRLVDTGNKFSLWCCTDPTFRFPFGWTKRDVDYVGGKLPGLRQRPL
jgi:hypothetical protein